MVRVLLISVAFVVSQLLVASWCMAFKAPCTSIMLAAALVVLVLRYFEGTAGLVVLLVVGLFLDVWLGNLLGVEVAALILLWLVGNMMVHWTGLESVWLLSAYGVGLAMAHRLMLMALGPWNDGISGWNVASQMALSFGDAFIGGVCAVLWLQLLVVVGQSERREETQVRLSRRPAKLSQLSGR